MPSRVVDWRELKGLAQKLSTSALGPGAVVDAEWKLLERGLASLEETDDWDGIIRLRDMFSFLVRGETTSGMSLVQQVNEAAIRAAEHLGDRTLAARYLHDSGENYHRQGYQEKSIEAFERSAALYKEEGESFKSLQSYYMTSLPYRALGERERAREILHYVLQQIDPDDPWRANPLEVMAWMIRDERQFAEAETVLRESLALYEQGEGKESIHVVQTLADLGEVIGLQRRYGEATGMLEESLAIVEKFGGQYQRQEARTKLKYAEMLIRQGDCSKALKLLDEADDKIRAYGHYYDLLWRLELARSFAFFKQRKWGRAIRKLRVVLRYRNDIGLLNSDFAGQLIKRFRWGTALPR